MEQINNEDVIKNSSKILGHQVENKPQLDTSKISLVAEVNPRLLRKINIVKRATSSTTSAATIYTTPSDKDFYLCFAGIGNTKDVTCDNSEIALFIIPFGESSGIQLINIPTTTLTASNNYFGTSFFPPILIKRSSTITVSGSFSLGTMTKTGTVTGYTVDENSFL
jgi:hypothetical protein